MKGSLLNKLIKGEKGQALLLVLILTFVGGIIITPMLSNISTVVNVGREVYEEDMYISYAADSGVEDALWQVKNKQLPNLFGDYNQYEYYDYDSSYEWQYNLAEEYSETVGMVNNKDVDVTFQNVWMPKDISVPSPTEAESIAEESRLAVFGSMSGSSATEYQIKIDYYYNNTNPAQPDYDPNGTNLRVQKLGIWLPPGYHYVSGTTNLTGACTPSSEEVEPYKGGESVVWYFSSLPQLSVFPSGSSSVNPMVKAVTFQITGPEGQSPGTALAWIVSTGVSGVSYSWDASVKVYKIISVASDDIGNELTIDAYAATTEALKRGEAISGDYCAIGGTLMTTTTDEDYRDKLFKESNAIVQDTDEDAPFYVPPNAHVDLAYLYWTGWLENAGVWGDSCDNFNNWVQDNDWTIYTPWWGGDKEFRGHHTSGTRYLKMNLNLDLSLYVGQTVSVSWQQREEGNLSSSDGLKYAFSRDGGNTWSNDEWAFYGNNPPSTKTVTIPSDYLTSQFRLRFYVAGCTISGRNVYVDDIRISVGGPPVENARVDHIMFNGYQVTADPSTEGIQTEQSGAIGAPNSLSYSCFYDVTSLVINDETLGANGTGTYTVGHVMDWPGSYLLYNYETGALEGTTAFPLGTPAQKTGTPPSFTTKYQWSYAAWSLIIVYSNPDTQGHQLYLYSDLRYADSNTTLNFSIGGFLAPEAVKDEDHAARLTCFVGEGDLNYSGDDIMVNETKLWDGTETDGNDVGDPNNVWNSTSVGLDESGIDIDTFTVVYPTIQPGDVEAQVRIDTDTDAWNLVYMILSFRSELVPAGTFSYLVR